MRRLIFFSAKEEREKKRFSGERGELKQKLSAGNDEGRNGRIERREKRERRTFNA